MFSPPLTKNVPRIEAIRPHPAIASGNNTPETSLTATPSVSAEIRDPQ